MRTTLDIDEDVLAAAKELARRERISAGRKVSRLLRRAPTGQGRSLPAIGDVASTTSQTEGFRPFLAQRVVTNAEVNELREAEGVCCAHCWM